METLGYRPFFSKRTRPPTRIQEPIRMMSLPCQICHSTPHGPRYGSGPVYIGKISDLCRPSDDQVLAGGQTNEQPNCNYAESLDGMLKPDDRRAALFGQTFISSYGSSDSHELKGENFSRIRWALGVSNNTSLSAIRSDLKVEAGKPLPLPLVFPVCQRCARLVRNYLHHRFVSKRLSEKTLYGFNLLYDVLLKRFTRENEGISHPLTLYCTEDSDEVQMLGRCVVVRSTTGPKVEQSTEFIGDIFMQIPSMPKWIASKLKPLQHEGKPAIVEEREPPTDRAALHTGLLSLPQELVEQVTWDLDRPAVLALRSTHRLLALRLPLDQAFWCNELLYGEPPLFGFEPLIDNHTARHPGELLGRIDALSQFGAGYTKPRTRSRFAEAQEPAKPVRTGIKLKKRDWKQYDWKTLVKLLATSSNFEDGGACADAPTGFLFRRRLWGELEKLVNAYT